MAKKLISTGPAALPGFTVAAVGEEWEPTKPKRLSPFDFLGAINETKTDLIKENPEAVKDYPPWMIGRGLSYFSDTARAANVMNRLSAYWSDVDPDVARAAKYQHFKFCLLVVPSRRRFQREWYKRVDDTWVEVVATYYECSTARAREMVKMHTEEQLEYMKQRISTGESDE